MSNVATGEQKDGSGIPSQVKLDAGSDGREGRKVRDRGLRALALERPHRRHPGSSPHELAAAYGFGLAKNHPFVDGNEVREENPP